MINVADLLPSEIERLRDEGVSADDQKAILASLDRFLAETNPDNGADTDRIYMAACMLTMANVWGKISTEEIAQILSNCVPANRKAFLEGLPHEFAGDVAISMVGKDDLSLLTLAAGSAIVDRPVQSRKLKPFGDLNSFNLFNQSIPVVSLDEIARHMAPVKGRYAIFVGSDGKFVAAAPEDQTLTVSLKR